MLAFYKDRTKSQAISMKRVMPCCRTSRSAALENV
jgi:hypothetical protein